MTPTSETLRQLAEEISNVGHRLRIQLDACAAEWEKCEQARQRAETARNPEWPTGVTVSGYMADHLWEDGAGCHWCGRRTESPMHGHDGMCLVPFVAAMLAALAPDAPKDRTAGWLLSDGHRAGHG